MAEGTHGKTTTSSIIAHILKVSKSKELVLLVVSHQIMSPIYFRKGNFSVIKMNLTNFPEIKS